ncbi:MAG: CsgG/HfaB family protein [Pseudomonadota bacterium]
MSVIGLNVPRGTALFVAATVLAGCVAPPPPGTYREPEIVPVTVTQTALQTLPPPQARIPVAVYDFPDETGQFKPQENVQTLSRAVSQGGASLLTKALRDAGNGQWFTILERNGLDALLKERQIIQDMRLRYLGERQVNPQALPPLLFAGIILQGGIVGFDTNTLTGGVGARFLGIGGDVEYRQNTVTVNLRAVSVKTGEVLANVTTSKTLASVAVSGGTFRFVSFDKLLEVEAGVTNNEPGTMALRRTIEKAVYGLIIEGSRTGLWDFADRNAAKALVTAYLAEERGTVPATEPRPGTKVARQNAETARTPRAAATEATPRATPGAAPATAKTAPRTARAEGAARSAGAARTERQPAVEPTRVAAKSYSEPATDEGEPGEFRWEGKRPVFDDEVKRKRKKRRKVRRKTKPATQKAAVVRQAPKADATAVAREKAAPAAKQQVAVATPQSEASPKPAPSPTPGRNVAGPRAVVRNLASSGLTGDPHDAPGAGPSPNTAAPTQPAAPNVPQGDVERDAQEFTDRASGA